MSDTPTADPESLAKRMGDFSPRLSPMLVKELRQGMRTNMFAIAFILLHTFMMLCLLTAMIDPGSSDSEAFFWFVIIVVLLFVQPLRGFSALSSEYQLNTMDLIHMTRLNGWRITLGKWTALNAQGLLFLTGVLPYLVIRYFLGNVNFIVDLIALLIIGIGSALATAITIGCSGFPNILLRGVACIALAILLSAFGGYVSSELLSSSAPLAFKWQFLGVMVLIGVFGCYYFLAFGASRISPLSENHATRKRLSALLAVALCFALSALQYDSEIIPAVITTILCIATVDALTEPLPVLTRVVQPFSKNVITRWLGLFLIPGWISGLFFFLLSTGILATIFFFNEKALGNPHELKNLLFILSACNTVVFPLLIISLFFHSHTGSRFTFALYMLIQAIIGGITIMVSFIAAAIGRWEELTFSLAPLPSVLIVAYERSELHNIQFLFIVPATTLICVVVPLVRGRKSFGKFIKHMIRSK